MPGRGDEAGAESVERLGPASTGVWIVTTRHTRHRFDLTGPTQTYQRMPGEGSVPMVHDNERLVLVRVDRPVAVGSSFFIWVEAVADGAYVEHWRQSSTIRSIVADTSGDACSHARFIRGVNFDPDSPVDPLGRWVVTTENSEYDLDLDGGRVRRRPIDGGQLRKDGAWVPLLAVYELRPQREMLLGIVVRGDGAETFRSTSPVLRVRPGRHE